VLGFEAEARVRAVLDAGFSGGRAAEKVASVELHAGLGGFYGEDAPDFGSYASAASFTWAARFSPST